MLRHLCSTSSSKSDNCTEEQAPSNRGDTFEYVWLTHVFLLFVAVILNGASFYLVTFIEKVRRISMTNFIAALNLIDLLGAFGCLIQCMLNYIFKLMYGTGIACQSEALCFGFFTFWQPVCWRLLSLTRLKVASAQARFSITTEDNNLTR
jgi:hypothetical protein